MRPLLCMLLAGLLVSSSARVDVRIGKDALRDPIPESFMGVSIEPLEEAPLYATNPIFLNLLGLLSNSSYGPFIVRWGGNSQDLNSKLYPDQAWQTLAELFRKTGVRYYLGLNMIDGKVSMAKKQIQNAFKHLPAESIFAISMGNEPDMYHSRKPNKFPLKYLDEKYLKDSERFFKALEPVLMKKLNTSKVFAGPEVTRAERLQSDTLLGWLAKTKYVQLASTHWYAGQSLDPNSGMATIHDDGIKQQGLTDVRRWVTLCKRNGLPFRMSETNSLNLGGKRGVSDALGGALFVVDWALTLAKEGVSGVNYHMASTPCAPYSAILLPRTCANGKGACCSQCESTCPAGSDPQARAPFYGLWMLNKLLDRGPSMMTDISVYDIRTASQYPYAALPPIKVHALRVGRTGSGVIRIVLIRRDDDSETVDVKITVVGKFTNARMYMLSSTVNGTLYALYPDVQLGGQQVLESGEVAGEAVYQSVDATVRDDYTEMDVRLDIACVAVIEARASF